MAYDEALAARIRDILDEEGQFSERKMFGGIAYMRREHMFVGIVQEDLMVRVGPDAYEAALKKKGVRPMDFTGRPMRGYVYVEKGAINTKARLRRWVMAGRDFADSLPPKKTRKPKPRLKKKAEKKKASTRKKSTSKKKS